MSYYGNLITKNLTTNCNNPNIIKCITVTFDYSFKRAFNILLFYVKAELISLIQYRNLLTNDCLCLIGFSIQMTTEFDK